MSDLSKVPAPDPHKDPLRYVVWAVFSVFVLLAIIGGWRHQAGTRHGGPQYFTSVSGHANAEIFSDPDSRAQRYRRSIATYGLLLLPFAVLVVVLWMQGNLFQAPEDWYLTPGLWDKQGAEFIGAFLFETPFVLVRAIGPLLLVAFCAYLIAIMAYQRSLYRKATS